MLLSFWGVVGYFAFGGDDPSSYPDTSGASDILEFLYKYY
jgi:hypothetical protein